MIHSQEKGERNIVVKLYLKGEEKLSLSRARNTLLVGDGDLWIKGIAEDPYFMASYQLDY